MKTRRTPGPWSIYKDRYRLFEKNCFVVSDDNVLIADAYATPAEPGASFC